MLQIFQNISREEFQKKIQSVANFLVACFLSSILLFQPPPSISHHQTHICDNDEKVCAGNNIVGNKSRFGGGYEAGQEEGDGIVNNQCNRLCKNMANILLNMLNKASEGKAVIKWNGLSDCWRTLCPHSRRRLWEWKGAVLTMKTQP